jgi:hypothetical protein
VKQGHQLSRQQWVPGGSDRIPLEIITAQKWELTFYLLLQCREKGTIQTVTLYKDKSNHSDENHHRVISLLSTIRKTFDSVVLNGLQLVAVFLLRNLQGKRRKQRHPLLIAFKDFWPRQLDRTTVNQLLIAATLFSDSSVINWLVESNFCDQVLN